MPYLMLINAVALNLCADHQWSVTIYLVVREQRLFFIFQKYKHTNRPILAIFHATIFSGGPRPRDKVCKWSSSIKKLRTAVLYHYRHGVSEKTVPNYFCQNFVKFLSILMIFGI